MNHICFGKLELSFKMLVLFTTICMLSTFKILLMSFSIISQADISGLSIGLFLIFYNM